MNNEHLTNIEHINQGICQFNEYFDKKYKFPTIDLNRLNDNSYFTYIANKSWNELRFPYAESKGVYFLFGRNSNDISEKSVYVGKASFSSTIGERFAFHLRKVNVTGSYSKNDLNGNIHNLEYILAIDLESIDLDVFSSALEEFLIKNLRKRINLLNGTGNKRK